MNFKMENRTYDLLCWIARIVIPAVGTLYFALAKIWGFPYAAEIVGTLTAIDTFLGVILGISDAHYDAEKANSYSVGEGIED